MRERELGFTLIELMVVVTIMLILTSLVVVNFAGLRVDRNLDIAQNELMTNLRRAQSYTLAGRIVTAGQSGQYYILKFDGRGAAATQYTLQVIYNAGSDPSGATLMPAYETYQLPQGIIVSSTPVTILGRKYSPIPQTGPCSLVVFKAPFGDILFNGQAGVNSGCDYAGFASDDYASVLNFAVNAPNYPTSKDSYAIVHLVSSDNPSKTRDVMIRGVTGVICATKDDVNCSN